MALNLPIIPLRNAVIFPGSVIPLPVGRPKTLRAVEAAQKNREPVALITQRSANIDDPGAADLFTYGVSAEIQRSNERPNGIQLIVRALKRVRVKSVSQTEPYLRAELEEIEDNASDRLKNEALVINIREAVKKLVEAQPRTPDQRIDWADVVGRVDHPANIVDVIAAAIEGSIEQKIEILGAESVTDRLQRVLALIHERIELAELSRKIDTQVKGEMGKTQRDYYLRQQLKAIKDELGESDDPEDALEELKGRLAKIQLPPDARKAADRELSRLAKMPTASAEYSVGRTYLEWIADLPWNNITVDSLDLAEVRRLMDQRHYGLEKVKKRILEFLAVRKLKAESKGPILCLVGPPGVGKTSLGQLVAQALGRKFHRISLGGVRDEAEIRGHRRTYVGALPGRLIQAMKKAGSTNPVLLLDEVDKLASDFRGDPSAALLEVLDPEQNNTFSDHYLEVPFDLSKVLFIATANQLDPIPAPLRDRMEVIEIPGYTHQEKRHIAVQHLVPKSLEAHGVTGEQVEFDPDALDGVIQDYTREAGVRSLERQINTVIRGIAVAVAEGKGDKTVVHRADLDTYLGPERYQSEVSERMEMPGVAIGLAWTQVGGDILFIEANRMNGKGKLTLTGQLGDVMKESAQAAISYLRTRSQELGVPETLWETNDIHVHLPAGATPKDGPSAGITLVTALASLVTGIKVRSDVAMTGEVTLRGNVLPVGGIKEKVLGALRAGIKEIILPERNRKDLVEVPDEVKNQLKFHFVSRVDEVLDLALEKVIERAARFTSEFSEPREAH